MYFFRIAKKLTLLWNKAGLIIFLFALWLRETLQAFINDYVFESSYKLLQQNTGKTLGVSELTYCLLEDSFCIYFVCEVGRKKAYVMSLNINTYACF